MGKWTWDQAKREVAARALLEVSRLMFLVASAAVVLAAAGLSAGNRDLPAEAYALMRQAMRYLFSVISPSFGAIILSYAAGVKHTNLPEPAQRRQSIAVDLTMFILFAWASFNFIRGIGSLENFVSLCCSPASWNSPTAPLGG
jgi:hypothetical protein